MPKAPTSIPQLEDFVGEHGAEPEERAKGKINRHAQGRDGAPKEGELKYNACARGMDKGRRVEVQEVARDLEALIAT